MVRKEGISSMNGHIGRLTKFDDGVSRRDRKSLLVVLLAILTSCEIETNQYCV